MTDLDRARAVGASDVPDDGLSRLFDSGLSLKERLAALKTFAAAIMARLRDLSRVPEEVAEFLTTTLSRLPVRGPDVLRAAYGTDTEVVAARVIDDAAGLAGVALAAAAIIPGPAQAVRAVKVVVHSIIELRMIAELRVLHGGPGSARDTTWLHAVLATWTAGQPVTNAGSPAGVVRDVVTKIRTSLAGYTSDAGRLAAVTSRGRGGADLIRQVGWRMHRRMRLHPQFWLRPDATSVGDMVRQTIRAHLPSLPFHGPQAGALTDSGQDVAAVAAPWPAVHLTRAWARHGEARRATEALDALAPATNTGVVDRLRAALAAQEDELRDLSRRLGRTVPVAQPEEKPPVGDELQVAHGQAWQAYDAMDLTEDTGARPRRLASWSARRRNLLVYLLAALAVSSPIVGMVGGGLVRSLGGVVALLVVQAVVLPMLTVALAAVVVGRLFRSWFGTRAPRTPFLGALVAFGAHGVIAAALAVVAVAFS
jgi:hypothetical protein